MPEIGYSNHPWHPWIHLVPTILYWSHRKKINLFSPTRWPAQLVKIPGALTNLFSVLWLFFSSQSKGFQRPDFFSSWCLQFIFLLFKLTFHNFSVGIILSNFYFSLNCVFHPQSVYSITGILPFCTEIIFKCYRNKFIQDFKTPFRHSLAFLCVSRSQS